jgi:arylsulfatase
MNAGSAYAGFGGHVGRTFATSTPWWPPRPSAPAGAPNIVVMVADDLGFSDLGCYGSEIATPHIDRIAGSGIRYSNFHSAPLCSPTRAALLTGRNSHAAGIGFTSMIDPGFPGYASELPANQPTMAEVLRDNGYSTGMVGKWHVCKDSDLHEAGDHHSWPLQRGFDRYYGFLEALTDFHHPHRLYEGNEVVEVDRYPDGYYLTDDLTDRAIQMIRSAKVADPTRPLFLYYSHGAVHAPLQAKATDIARQRGLYEEGWDVLRELRLRRQIELGVVSPGTELPPRTAEPGEDVVPWDSLAPGLRRLFARYMEVYAAMVESVDESAGRIRAALEELGQWDNTIFLFMSDNGASREGRELGTTSYFRFSGAGAATDLVADLERFDLIGGPAACAHYPRGWAMASNTPFRLYKMSTYRGGHQVPMVMSWPRGQVAQTELVRPQYVHVTSVLPTLLELIGVDFPARRGGLEARAPSGPSFATTLHDPRAPSVHDEQYYECVGSRAFYRQGWEAVTFHRPLTSFRTETWELFNVESDPTQCHDLAAQHPQRLAELQARWEEAAWANQVFPLNEGTGLANLLRPEHDEVLSQPIRIPAGTPSLERYRSSRLITGRPFRVVVEWEYRAGDEGVLVAHGGQQSGYLLYVEDGMLNVVQNAYGSMVELPAVTLPSASREMSLDVTPIADKRWKLALAVDGEPVASSDHFVQLGGYLPFEGIDVGIDRRSPVSWELYQRRGPFPYSGRLVAVRYEPGQVTAALGTAAIASAIEMGLGLE